MADIVCLRSPSDFSNGGHHRSPRFPARSLPLDSAKYLNPKMLEYPPYEETQFFEKSGYRHKKFRPASITVEEGKSFKDVLPIAASALVQTVLTAVAKPHLRNLSKGSKDQLMRLVVSSLMHNVSWRLQIRSTHGSRSGTQPSTALWRGYRNLRKCESPFLRICKHRLPTDVATFALSSAQCSDKVDHQVRTA